MEDKDKKNLMVWLGEYCPACSKNEWRTFLTDKDMMDCMRQLVKEGKWIRFYRWTWLYGGGISGGNNYEERQVSWLMRPTNEQGEPHFCRLVVEFLGKEGKG